MKKLGHATQIAISMEGPLSIATVIELKNLNILVGVNGVGKSLILKLTWVLQMVANLVILKQPLEEGAQFILDKSIPDHETWGLIGIKFDSGAQVDVSLMDGKVMEVAHQGFEDIDKPVIPIFMSSDMRLFSSMSRYMSLRKTIGKEKMHEHYKLHDVCYMEGLILKMPLVLTGNEPMLSMIELNNLRSIELEDDFIGVFEDGTKKKLSLLSNGQQAALNMAIATL